MSKAAPTLLVVEDSPEDYEAVVRALGVSGFTAEVRRCETGEDALEYLRREGDYADAPRPSVVLLDLNLPGINGCEFVQQCKSDDALKTIPLVILTSSLEESDVRDCYLTSSLEESDVRDCYESGANSYHQKPMRHGELVSLLATLGRYWFSAAVLPEDSRSKWPRSPHPKTIFPS